MLTSFNSISLSDQRQQEQTQQLQQGQQQQQLQQQSNRSYSEQSAGLLASLQLQDNCSSQHTNEKHYYDLFKAAREGQSDRLRVLLTQHLPNTQSQQQEQQQRLDVAFRDRDGDTALHMASKGGHLLCVVELVLLHAPVNAKNGLGHTPLFTHLHELFTNKAPALAAFLAASSVSSSAAAMSSPGSLFAKSSISSLSPSSFSSSSFPSSSSLLDVTFFLLEAGAELPQCLPSPLQSSSSSPSSFSSFSSSSAFSSFSSPARPPAVSSSLTFSSAAFPSASSAFSSSARLRSPVFSSPGSHQYQHHLHEQQHRLQQQQQHRQEIASSAYTASWDPSLRATLSLLLHSHINHPIRRLVASLRAENERAVETIAGLCEEVDEEREKAAGNDERAVDLGPICTQLQRQVQQQNLQLETLTQFIMKGAQALEQFDAELARASASEKTVPLMSVRHQLEGIKMAFGNIQLHGK